MRPLRAISLSVLASALLIATSMAQQFAATVRIVNPIDESQLVTLKGNTHPAATAVNDRGPVSPSLALTDLIMVLSRSPQQQAAFDKFVADQYNPNSPDFHHWLEPEEVGTNFGPSQVDIATISNWLTGHGFTIDEVSKDRMAIHFSGTAGQVQSAFHTEIHNLEVKGVPHIGNMSDPQIPAALAPAVVGVKALHNFYPRPQHKLGSLVQKDSKLRANGRRSQALPALIPKTPVTKNQVPVHCLASTSPPAEAIQPTLKKM
jgi:subtilase family serine protease